MSEQKRTNYVSVVMTDDEIKQLDDWAWHRRIRARSDAVRQLIVRGYSVPDEPAPAAEPAVPKRSAKARTSAEPAEAPKPAAAAKPRKGSA